MVKVRIQLEKKEDLPKLNAVASIMPFDIDLVSGWYVVDAKSLIGLFGLDLSTPIRVDIYADRKTAEPFLYFIHDMLVE